ncbi:MAG: VOC family protein [Proteobacteria bacterium]|nr:VOC family protein [Pseudomonadota bacterium]MDA0915570.1 VOC family protein [Pseudomonadota bacterium]MDA1032805.1 VOC family protein [Pseudomonadota bacterium]
MPHGKIEHVNMTVSDIDRSAALFEKLLGWKERWRGPALNGGTTIHVGDDESYLAIYTNGRAQKRFSKGQPLNHVRIEVDDLDAAEKIVLDHELETFSHSEYDPGPTSFYFFDWDGIEFEVVSYAGETS